MNNLLKIATVLLLFIVQFSFAQEDHKLKIDHGPYLQNVSQTSVDILFHTDAMVVPGIILYEKGENPRLVQNRHDGLLNVDKGIHKVIVTGLKPGRSYSYKAFCIDVINFKPYECTFGDTVYSSKGTFDTLDPTKNEVKFTVFCDAHDNSSRIGKYLEHSNISEQDFYLLNGDIMGHVDEEVQIFASFIDTCVSRFAQNIPFLFIRGNHETRGAYARELKSYLSLKDDSYYFAFTHGPARFIVLDSGEDKKDDNIEYSGLVDFESYRERQLDWLKKEVSSKEFRRAKVNIVVVHMPILKETKSRYGMAQLAKYYGPVLKNAGIDLMISGHVHKNQWIDSRKSGFGYPIVICSNQDFLEVELNSNSINLKIKGQDGQLVQTQYITLKGKRKRRNE